MDITDSKNFGSLAVKLGLLTPAQLADATAAAIAEGGKELPALTRALERKGLLTNYQTAKLLKGDLDGYFQGGYRILYKIQSGSFGRVFRADEPSTGRVVAVKVLRRKWSEDQQKIDLFLREGKVGLTLKHPNIVEVLAVSQDPRSKAYYLVMEFIEGGNLKEVLKLRHTLRVGEALRVLEDAASGLAHAYSRGITHRDIKLTNILVNTQGEAKLVDFGLAQMFAAMGAEGEQMDRTVDYAGLEKATGVKAGDVRSDLFFLGCVFYECLTGRPPIEATKDRHARMSARRFQEIHALRPDEVEAPASVFTLSETLLSFDPKRRYQTPSQLVEAVKAARRDLGPAAGAKPEPAARGAAGKTLFLAEADVRLQEGLRGKLRDMGYRVLLASDPTRALERFRQQPYDALLVDVGTTGEDGLLVFEQIMIEARDKRVRCVGIAIFNEDQSADANKVATDATTGVLVRPVSSKQLKNKLVELSGEK
ncbi:MAG: protein kinase domain-containing protein [Gemmataceae bacterium]